MSSASEDVGRDKASSREAMYHKRLVDELAGEASELKDLLSDKKIHYLVNISESEKKKIILYDTTLRDGC